MNFLFSKTILTGIFSLLRVILTSPTSIKKKKTQDLKKSKLHTETTINNKTKKSYPYTFELLVYTIYSHKQNQSIYLKKNPIKHNKNLET